MAAALDKTSTVYPELSTRDVTLQIRNEKGIL